MEHIRTPKGQLHKIHIEFLETVPNSIKYVVKCKSRTP